MFEDVTVESLKAAILAGVKERGWSVQEGSFADTIAGPMAAELMRLYQTLPAMVPMFYVDTTAGLYIDKAANEFFGIYRKEGSQATAPIAFTGEAGLRIPAGTIFLTADGLEFFLDQDVTLDETGQGSGTVSSNGVGEAYDIGAGELTAMHVNLAGLISYHNEAASGGIDTEDDPSLMARLDERRKRPPTSGNCYYYEQLALETDGVGLAKAIELYDGPGTVGVIIADEDGRPVEEAVRAACAAHIETGRVVGTGVTVLSAEGVEIVVSATVQLDSTTTAEAVRTALVSNLDTYLATLAETWSKAPGEYTLLYNRVVFLLLDIDGVVDYTQLTINGGTENIVLTTLQVPTLGEVTVDEAG